MTFRYNFAISVYFTSLVRTCATLQNIRIAAIIKSPNSLCLQSWTSQVVIHVTVSNGVATDGRWSVDPSTGLQ